jgi:glycosyltransferase involved in cell wall biosynthesis
MRIAHFVQRYPPAIGGSEAYFARLGRHLSSVGDKVTVFTTAALDLEAFWSPHGRCLAPGRAVEDGVEVRRYPLWRFRGRRYLLKPLSLIPQRTWQCLTLPCNPIAWDMWTDAGREPQTFDIVHATAFPYAWPIACGLRLARRLGLPFVLTPFLHLGDLRDSRDRTRRSYLQPALLSQLRRADAIFVQTLAERDVIKASGIDPTKLILQGMGVAPEECTAGDRHETRRRWRLEEGEIVIGHLANLSAEKGTVDLLSAAAQLWERGISCRVVLAGPEMPNFQRFWRYFPRQEQVTHLGVLDERSKRDFFASIDVFALPSRSDSFGLVLLEAWANRVPCVAYRAGGPGEVIHDREDGLLVRCGDLAGLATALEHLVQESTLRRRLGDAGRQRVEQEFRWPDKLQLVRNVYQKLAGSQDRVA